MYYREAFLLEEQLPKFMAEQDYGAVEAIPADELIARMFPPLFHARLPRYQSIADHYGYTVYARDAACVENEADFVQPVARALDGQ